MAVCVCALSYLYFNYLGVIFRNALISEDPLFFCSSKFLQNFTCILKILSCIVVNYEPVH